MGHKRLNIQDNFSFVNKDFIKMKEKDITEGR